MPDSQAKRDLRISLAGFIGSAALQGLAVLSLAHFGGEEVLGIFDQGGAVYLIISQLVSGGICLAVSQKIARLRQTSTHRRLFYPLLVFVLILGAAGGWGLFACRSLLSTTLGSPALRDYCFWLSLATVFYSANKYAVTFLTARRIFLPFALAQVLRGAGFAAGVGYYFWGDRSPGWLGCCFLIAELFVAPMVVWSVYAHLRPRFTTRHFFRIFQVFGLHSLKAFSSNFLHDVNTRIDVLLLGYFLADAQVGIYSFGIFFIEVFYRINGVLIVNVNPLLAQLWKKGDSQTLSDYIFPAVKKFYLQLGILLCALALVYWGTVEFLIGSRAYRENYPAFFFMLFCLGLGVGWQPFYKVFNQFNRPGLQTKTLTLVVLLNFVGNYLLIPHLGLLGAGIATGGANLCLVLCIRSFVHKFIQQAQVD